MADREKKAGTRILARGATALILALSGVGGSHRAVQAGELISPGCGDGGEEATVSAIGPALDLILADGRNVVLPGLDPVRPTEARPGGVEAARAALTAWLVGRPVRIAPQRGEPDRWGRTVALAFAPSPHAASQPDASVSVAEAMLEAGLSRARPDPTIAACWTRYLAIESASRSAGLGLWNDPYYAVIKAEDAAGLTQRTGGMAIVEGRVTDVREGRARFYVRLGRAGGAGFALAIEKRTAARLAKAGTDPSRWSGRTLRARGFLDDRFGLQIDLATLSQVEFINP